jgi:hypothetical protein
MPPRPPVFGASSACGLLAYVEADGSCDKINAYPFFFSADISASSSHNSTSVEAQRSASRLDGRWWRREYKINEKQHFFLVEKQREGGESSELCRQLYLMPCGILRFRTMFFEPVMQNWTIPPDNLDQ